MDLPAETAAMDIEAIQDYLRERQLDGWLLADFHARNDIAVEVLGLSGIVTRRSFYFVPCDGRPTGVVHAVERHKFQKLPGNIVSYSSYQVLEKQVRAALAGCKRVAMEYSPMGRLPYIGLVDAGTIELVRSFGVEVVTSADLVASFQARLTAEQIAAHRIAARNVIEIKNDALAFIRQSLLDGKPLKEYDVTRFILNEFEKYDMETANFPICAAGANAGNPHYELTAERSEQIRKGHLILVDLWAKMKRADGVYADITWMAFADSVADIPEKYKELFATVVGARDAAVAFIHENIDKRPLYGAEVDDVCRKVVADAGFGDYFTHRTGHSIGRTEHGTGPNIDNLETEDNRRLQEGHLFSIEPGIYLQDCGFRTEINVLIGRDSAEVTTLPLQTEIIPLF